MADPREEAIRRHYDRRSQPQSFLDQKAASSRPGQVYHTMTSLQDRMSRPGYTPARADTDQLKDLRRDWNRNQKYTPQGMSVSGATSPLDAQKRFMDTTETFRQANKPAYNKMYPFTGGYMDISEKGGLWGALLSNLAKKTWKNRSALKELNPFSKILDLSKSAGAAILGNDGIGGALDTNKDELENYANLTYGPHLEDVPYGGPPPDVYEGRRPHEDMPLMLNPPYQREVKLPVEAELTRDVVDEPELTRDEQIAQVLEDPGIDTSAEFLLTPPKTEEELRREQLLRELEENMVWSDAQEVPDEPLPFEDPRTESGIANLMPGGPLYDAIPHNQRLNMHIADEMRKRGPHYREPRTSYYGSNWYDEYKRNLENEMEIAKGIRSPMDR
jgi:hypothetical protein